MKRSSTAADVNEVVCAVCNGQEEGKRKSARSKSIASASALLVEGGQVEEAPLHVCQVHENDIAKVVIVCEPDLPKMMGALHPLGSLYERPVNLDVSKKQHTEFRNLLRSHGCRVLTVREILKFGTERSVSARLELEDMAAKSLSYEVSPECEDRLSKKDMFYIGEEYKKQVLEEMSSDQLVDILLTNPTVHITPSYRDTGFRATYQFSPLSNLVFTRDQQITTCKGIVMGKLRSPQRANEVQLTKFCFKKLGLKIVGGIEEPGYLEGGDFFAAGWDLCFVGVGLRSNLEACRQCMEKDWFGAKRVAVVKDDFDRSQDRMHLDCVFSILGDDCALMLEDMMGENSPTRRLVDEYVRVPEGQGSPGFGDYQLERENVEFSEYLSDNGYHVLPISGKDQLAYGCNCLNMGDSNIIAVHKDTARKISRFEHFHGNVEYLPYDQITSMYGAVHCSSQVVHREQ